MGMDFGNTMVAKPLWIQVERHPKETGFSFRENENPDYGIDSWKTQELSQGSLLRSLISRFPGTGQRS